MHATTAGSVERDRLIAVANLPFTDTISQDVSGLFVDPAYFDSEILGPELTARCPPLTHRDVGTLER